VQRAELEALYVKLERRLYNVVYRQLWHASDAHDVVQESFVRLWKMRERVRDESVEPLVFRIALNMAKNRRRTRRLWQWVPFADASSAAESAEDALANAGEERRMRRALDGLPAELRDVLVLCELSELPHKAVAEALGIAEGTVGSRRNTALARLRKVLDV
jgi:RNA polymerase sigma-70 factor (ECF subfamily)